MTTGMANDDDNDIEKAAVPRERSPFERQVLALAERSSAAVRRGQLYYDEGVLKYPRKRTPVDRAVAALEESVREAEAARSELERIELEERLAADVDVGKALHSNMRRKELYRWTLAWMFMSGTDGDLAKLRRMLWHAKMMLLDRFPEEGKPRRRPRPQYTAEGRVSREPGPDYKRLGLMLRAMREAKGLSREALAEKLTIARTTLNGYEGGERKPPLDEIRAWAEACDFRLEFDFLPADEQYPAAWDSLHRAFAGLGSGDMFHVSQLARCLPWASDDKRKEFYALVRDLEKLHPRMPRETTRDEEDDQK